MSDDIQDTDPHDGRTTVVRNDDKRRYEIRLGDTVAGFTLFRPDEKGRLVFPHTEIDPAFGGRGLGAELVGSALQDVAARGESVVPVCPFVVKYLRTHEVDGLDVHWRPTADSAGSGGIDT